MGRVRHRLYGQIQRRFEAAGIVIPLPTRELRVHAMNAEHDATPSPGPTSGRTRPGPTSPAPARHRRGPLPVPAEECHRGVDE